MFHDFFPFEQHNEFVDLTKFVSPYSLSEEQTRCLLWKTSADNKNYKETVITMSRGSHKDALMYWATEARAGWTHSLIKSAQDLVKKGITFPVCIF